MRRPQAPHAADRRPWPRLDDRLLPLFVAGSYSPSVGTPRDAVMKQTLGWMTSVNNGFEDRLFRCAALSGAMHWAAARP